MNHRPKLDANKGYMISLVLSLILVSSLLIGYYIVTHWAEPEGYTTIYLLDFSQKKAIDYPELVVRNFNNTFKVWVEVENHMRDSLQGEVQLKITDSPITELPVNVNSIKIYDVTDLENGQSQEILASVDINEAGMYSVVFELWISGEFSHNYCVLNVEVVDSL